MAIDGFKDLSFNPYSNMVKFMTVVITNGYVGMITSGGGLHEMGKGSVRAAIASEGYLSDDEFRLHDMHVHDQLFIAKNDEHVEEISMKQ